MYNKKPARCAGVVVRLSEQYIDSLNNPLRKTIAYLKTDNNGCVVFEGLNPNSSYSVLPITLGYEFGSPKGSIGGNLSCYYFIKRTALKPSNLSSKTLKARAGIRTRDPRLGKAIHHP